MVRLLLFTCLLLPISLFGVDEKKFFIGAYDPQHWAGLTMTTADRQGFGFYLEIEKDGQRAKGYDIFHIIKRVGPNSDKGFYSCLDIDASLPFGLGDKTPILDKSLTSDTITWEWTADARNGTVLGRVTNNSPALIRIHFYTPWDYRSQYRIRPDRVQGESGAWRFMFQSDLAGEVNDGEASLTYRVSRGGGVCFAARIGNDLKQVADVKTKVEITLRVMKDHYSNKRVAVIGANPCLAESIVNNLNWMVLLQPEKPALYTPAGRRWIFPAPGKEIDHWTIFEWDSFFNGLLLGVESHDLAKAAVSAVLGAQYASGCIANWRGRFAGSRDRAQPPVGSFAMLKLFQRYHDRDLLVKAYPILRKFNFFWTDRVATGHSRRDGNDNGLLEWGSDADQLEGWKPEWEEKADGRQRAAWESGEDDLPNFDNVPFNEKTWTLELESVDINSFFALDCECLSIIAGIIGNRQDEKLFRERYERTRSLINGLLWDEQAGVYRDRRWSGELSPRLAAANFLPLIAGIPDEKRAERMMKNLADPGLFWGDFVIPTINRKDPAFFDQQYWRGTIWPPTNYLIYQGLVRYNNWEMAADLARKSMKMFLDTWNTFQLCRENYDSRNGAGGGQRYQSWGPLFALMGIEEFISWDIQGRLKVGSLQAGEESVLKNISDGRRFYRVLLSEAKTELAVNGKPVFAADGPVVLQDLRWSSERFKADAFASRECRLELFLTGKKFQAAIDDREEFLEKPVVAIPAGRHTLKVLRRE